MSIALKEADETDYWIERINEPEPIFTASYDSIKPEIVELLKLLKNSRTAPCPTIINFPLFIIN